MLTYLKQLEETLIVRSEGAMERISESLDVQLDRWRLGNEAANRPAVVQGYEMHMSFETEDDTQVIVNTMTVKYKLLNEVLAYGIGARHNPLEARLYGTLQRRLKPQVLTGRVLLLCPSLMHAMLIGADAELSAAHTDDLDPEKFGTELYGLIIADRVLSRVKNPSAIMAGIYRALQRGGNLLIIEDAHGHAKPEILWRFSEPTLRSLLEEYRVLEVGSCGNSRLVGHLVSGNGWWTPLPAQLQDSFEVDSPRWPVYTWALAKK